MRLRRLALIVALGLATPAPAQTPDHAAALVALQAMDVRVAAVADRLMAANAGLCRDTMPLTGLILQSTDQFEGNGNVPPRVMIGGVVPGSPADLAGVMIDDQVVRIGGQAVAGMAVAEGAPLRDAAFAALADQPSSAPLALIILRNGQERALSITPRPGCRALVEVLTEDGLRARSDGRLIQITYEFAAQLDDDGLAVILAHELAHSVLAHRARLAAAGAEPGFFGLSGRSLRLRRQVEQEADLMSVHLLANAGYDPAIAPAYWRSDLARRAGGGRFRSRAYLSPTDRADLIVAEIARYLPPTGRLSMPEHLLALRDHPFGD